MGRNINENRTNSLHTLNNEPVHVTEKRCPICMQTKCHRPDCASMKHSINLKFLLALIVSHEPFALIALIRLFPVMLHVYIALV